jgi:hypothetical protein
MVFSITKPTAAVDVAVAVIFNFSAMVAMFTKADIDFLVTVVTNSPRLHKFRWLPLLSWLPRLPFLVGSYGWSNALKVFSSVDVCCVVNTWKTEMGHPRPNVATFQ